MKTLYKDIAAVIQNAVLPHSALPIHSENIGAILKIGKKHQTLPMLIDGLYKAGADLTDWEETVMHALQIVASDNYQADSLRRLQEAFDEKGVDYALLKGAALKKMYPASEMRLMSDIDILIRQEQYEAVRQCMQNLGYTHTTESDHEIVWKKKPYIVVELHKRVIPSYNEDYYRYYTDPWEKFKPDAQKPNQYWMNREDEYIYLFTHMTKHFRDGGIGLRHITDLWLYRLKNPDIDWAYIETEMEKMKLGTFYKNVEKAICALFSGGAEDQVTEYMIERFVESGAYGLREKCKIADAAKKSAREGSAQAARKKQKWGMLFPAMFYMKQQYPILRKLPFLLPFMWIYRLLNIVLFKRSKIRSGQKRLNQINDDATSAYYRELSFVGLQYDLQENAHSEEQRKSWHNS